VEQIRGLAHKNQIVWKADLDLPLFARAGVRPVGRKHGVLSRLPDSQANNALRFGANGDLAVTLLLQDRVLFDAEHLIASRVSGLYFSVCVWLQTLPSAIELGSRYLAVFEVAVAREWPLFSGPILRSCFVAQNAPITGCERRSNLGRIV
jgi:hypothetical protein